jgi:AcrR family transcriptional regulator
MSPRVSEQYLSARRQQLLRGAREALVLAPISETTTADIAAAADVSEGTLYNYFESKQALLVELAGADRTTPAIGQGDVLDQGDMRQELRDLLAMIFDERLDDSDIRSESQLSLTWWQAAVHDAEIRRAQREAMDPLLATLEIWVCRWQQRGDLDRTLHPPAAAQAITSLILGLRIFDALDGRVDWIAYAHAVEVLLTGTHTFGGQGSQT